MHLIKQKEIQDTGSCCIVFIYLFFCEVDQNLSATSCQTALSVPQDLQSIPRFPYPSPEPLMPSGRHRHKEDAYTFKGGSCRAHAWCSKRRDMLTHAANSFRMRVVPLQISPRVLLQRYSSLPDSKHSKNRNTLPQQKLFLFRVLGW